MMRTGFTRKKVESLTLGEKLRKIRQEYHITLGEVAKHTGIPVRHLERLESGRYEEMPSDVYVRGFLRNYARFLGADEDVLIRLYERERNIHANLQPEESSRSWSKEGFRLPRFVVTPRVFAIGASAVLVFGGFLYLYREYEAFVSAPYLVIIEPADGAIIEGSTTYVRGRTDREAKLTINRQPTIVNGGGEFSELVRLQPGVNTLTITSVNKFDKEKTEAIVVQANYETQSEGGSMENGESVQLEQVPDQTVENPSL